ncbi:MAG: acetyl-CoA carboxylase biotin carboxyl carrier protein subunit, partial [Clostridiales bacterium]|nr:acetyl-CoA carboxylase biotin carboxyl carrier protein subunit [Clostridiales bacterium]
MRNFIITVDGKKFEVGVEEVGMTASAPQAPKAVSLESAAPAPAAAQTIGSGTKLLSPFPGL